MARHACATEWAAKSADGFAHTSASIPGPIDLDRFALSRPRRPLVRLARRGRDDRVRGGWAARDQQAATRLRSAPAAHNAGVTACAERTRPLGRARALRLLVISDEAAAVPKRHAHVRGGDDRSRQPPLLDQARQCDPVAVEEAADEAHDGSGDQDAQDRAQEQPRGGRLEERCLSRRAGLGGLVNEPEVHGDVSQDGPRPSSYTPRFSTVHTLGQVSTLMYHGRLAFDSYTLASR